MRLTQDERNWAIEQAISHVENRSVERMIRQAENYEAAVKVAYRECRWWGGWGGPHEPRLMGEESGIKVVTTDGRVGVITYDEIAQYVRGPRQLFLF